MNEYSADMSFRSPLYEHNICVTNGREVTALTTCKRDAVKVINTHTFCVKRPPLERAEMSIQTPQCTPGTSKGQA